MSKLLTTGQMIDQLKVGEVAENDSENKAYVTRKEHGYFMQTTLKNLEEGKGIPFVLLVPSIIKCKWRILPKYVTFEEAMKAIREDENKLVYLHVNDNFSIEINSRTFLEITFAGSIDLTFSDLVCGNWTIEEA